MKECKPWSGDVLEEVSRPGSGKSVVFSDNPVVEQSLSPVEPRPMDEDHEHDSATSPVIARGSLDEWVRSGDQSQDDEDHQDTPQSEVSHGS